MLFDVMLNVSYELVNIVVTKASQSNTPLFVRGKTVTPAKDNQEIY